MKLSTKGRYGIKAMVDLAVARSSAELMSISALAAAQGISEAYLEQLISALKKAELVDSVRGAQGGYRLAREPEKISVGEILRVLEGSTDLVDCVSSNGSGCENACNCSARPLWLKLQNRINDVLGTTTLADMADDYITQLKRNEANEA